MGYIGKHNNIQLLTAATAVNGVPSGATAGVVVNLQGSDDALFALKSTAGSGVMTVTVRLWGYSRAAADWMPLGSGTGASKGILNAQTAIDETGTDLLRHLEVISGMRHVDRVYAEITAIGGTATAVSAWLEGTV